MNSAAPRVLILVAAQALAGCFSPNAYTTPEPVAPGRVVVTVAPEITRVTRRTSTDPRFGDVEDRSTGTMPLLPTMLFRIGVTKGLDTGIGLKNGSALAVDLKVALKRGVVGAALMPSVQASLPGIVADLPLLVDIKAGEHVAFVLSPGALYADKFAHNSSILTTQPHGLLGRVGIGIALKLSRDFALQPEATVARSLDGGGITWLTGGLGVTGSILP